MAVDIRERNAAPPRHDRGAAATRVGAGGSVAAAGSTSTRERRIDSPISSVRVLAARLKPHEWRRRLMHFFPGFLPVILLVAPHPDPLEWYVTVPIFAVTMALVTFALRNGELFKRRGEAGWRTSVISYAIITLTLMLAFPAQPELGLAVTTIIAFGDGSATIAGLLVRGRRLPWNQEKSCAGLAAFLACSIPLATLVYWGEARPGVPLSLALTCVAPAAFVAALAESIPTRINDNIRVGLAAGLTILVMHGIFVGW